jgi:hypothetical protein
MHFNSHIDLQGWLPPCHLSVGVAGSVIHDHILNHQINQKAPATLTTRPGAADQNGHPGRSFNKNISNRIA